MGISLTSPHSNFSAEDRFKIGEWPPEEGVRGSLLVASPLENSHSAFHLINAFNGAIATLSDGKAARRLLGTPPWPRNGNIWGDSSRAVFCAVTCRSAQKALQTYTARDLKTLSYTASFVFCS